MRNIAYINVNNLLYNVKSVKKLLKKRQKFYAVVKADAYGHGAEKIANIIYPYVDGYVVATVEEGVSLRRSGIDKPVILLYGTVNYADTVNAVRHDITVTVSSVKEVNRIKKATKELAKTACVHVAVNTGMNREGANTPQSAEEIFMRVKKSRRIIATGVYSHYYKPEDDNVRREQQKSFNAFVAVARNYFPNITAHISASGGLIAGDSYDAVRIGILLYGYTPFPTDKIKVKPVMSVFSYNMFSKRLNKGQQLLYGNGKCPIDGEYSFIRFGYADSLPRKGAKYNRCMDLSAVESCGKRKIAVLYKNAVQLAKKYDTIPYEILVCIAKRCEKVYRMRG